MNRQKLLKQMMGMALVLLTGVILTTCGPSQAELDAQATEVAAIIFATQTAEAPTLTPIPTLTSTPTPTLGQVKGILVDKSTDQAIPARISLIPVEVGDDGSVIYSQDLLNERFMILDTETGIFLFEDVKPGHYLISANIDGGMPLDLRDDQGTELVLLVKAGQVLDLGKLSVEK